MGRFEDNLLKQLGLSQENVTPEMRESAKETEERWRRRGAEMSTMGCGMTVAGLLVLILLVLVL